MGAACDNHFQNSGILFARWAQRWLLLPAPRAPAAAQLPYLCVPALPALAAAAGPQGKVLAGHPHRMRASVPQRSARQLRADDESGD